MRIDIETFGLDLEWPPVNGWVIDPHTEVTKESIWEGLEVIATASTGTNHIDCGDIPVLSLLDDREGLSEIRASSEFTFFLILAALRGLNRMTYPLFYKTWVRHENSIRGNELYDKIVGIIGMGRIGQNIYKWCYSFGAIPKYLCDPPAGYAHSLEDVFQNSDVVVISCALTEQTIDMIDGILVQSMKERACLINSARGELIIESELVEVLKARPDLIYATDVLAGMTSDTQYSSPLLGLNNAIVFPHVAGMTFESNEKALRITNKLLWNWYKENK